MFSNRGASSARISRSQGREVRAWMSRQRRPSHRRVGRTHQNSRRSGGREEGNSDDAQVDFMIITGGWRLAPSFLLPRGFCRLEGKAWSRTDPEGRAGAVTYSGGRAAVDHAGTSASSGWATVLLPKNQGTQTQPNHPQDSSRGVVFPRFGPTSGVRGRGKGVARSPQPPDPPPGGRKEGEQ